MLGTCRLCTTRLCTTRLYETHCVSYDRVVHYHIVHNRVVYNRVVHNLDPSIPYQALFIQPKIKIISFGINNETVNANIHLNQKLDEKFTDFSHIYTDASKIDENSSVGFAFYHYNSKYSKYLSLYI